jgi:metal-sulfur cluster biosynthetic enzyme
MDPDTAEQRIRQALALVNDPEIGHSIVELGLVDRIDVEPGRVQVTLVPTSVTCPMADLLVERAEAAVREVSPPATEVAVEMDWEQQWSPERMSEALRRSFGW